MQNNLNNNYLRGGKLLKAWRRWRAKNLPTGMFLRCYMYDRVLVRPKRKVRKWLKR